MVHPTASHVVTNTHAWAFIGDTEHGYLSIYSLLSELLILSKNVKKSDSFSFWLTIKYDINENSAHKTSFYALHVIVEEIHPLSLQIKLAVTYAKFPLNEGKFGIVRKNIPFKFYKYTEVSPDRNSQSPDWTNCVGLHFPWLLNFPFKIMWLNFPD